MRHLQVSRSSKGKKDFSCKPSFYSSRTCKKYLQRLLFISVRIYVNIYIDVARKLAFELQGVVMGRIMSNV